MAVEIVRIIFNFVEYFDDQRLERVDWIDVSIDNKVLTAYENPPKSK